MKAHLLPGLAPAPVPACFRDLLRRARHPGPSDAFRSGVWIFALGALVAPLVSRAVFPSAVSRAVFPSAVFPSVPQGVLAVWAFSALLRVPSRRLVGELLLLSVLSALLAPGAPVALAMGIGAAALSALLLGLSIEAGTLPLNALDHGLVITTYAGRPVMTHYVVESRTAFNKAALLRSIEALIAEVPLLRSFVREAPLGIERFFARELWLPVADLLSFPTEPIAPGAALDLDAPIDLERRPPVRFTLALRPGGGHALVVSLHHAASDGAGGLALLDRLLRRYSAEVQRIPVVLPPIEAGTRRFRDLLLPRGLLWSATQLVRALRTLGDMRIHSASVLEDENASPRHLRVRVVDVPVDLWGALKRRAGELGQTRYHLLLSAALRAADRWRSARGLPERPFHPLIPADMRPLLGGVSTVQNYASDVPVTLSVAEVRSEALPGMVKARMEEGRTLEGLLRTPLCMAFLGAVLPPALYRRILRNFDGDPGSFLHSFLISHPRLHADLHVPPSVALDRVWCCSTVSRQPGFGMVITALDQRVTVAFEYVEPLITDAGVEDFAARFDHALREMAGLPG